MQTLMKVSSLLLGLILALGSCDKIDPNLPMVERGRSTTLSYEAQTKTYLIKIRNGKPYNNKIDWHIQGISFGDGPNPLMINKVDTLPDGDMRIAHDWATFIVPKHKGFVQVTVTENTDTKPRQVSLQMETSGLLNPGMLITQQGRP